MKGNPKQSWIQDFMQWIPYSRHWIPVFVNGTWILDSNHQWNSGFLELYSGFQSPAFPLPQAKFPGSPNLDSITCLGSDRANIQITAYSFLGSWSWLPVLVSSQLNCVKKTGPLVAFTSKNVYWLSSVPCTPYRRPLISLLTPHMICFCVRSHLAHMPC